MKEAKRCSHCVLSNAFFDLVFDEMGQCQICKQAIKRREFEWFPDDTGRLKLSGLTALLKTNGQNRPYDAMIGLSGGIDSAYLAHFAVKEMGLRVLAVHVDAGWNSHAAVQNIERLVRSLDLDLFTYVVEWEEMRDLQLSFLKASVYNQDIPQDHAFFSTLYRTAEKFNIAYFLSGVNYSSENVVPTGSNPGYLDAVHIKAIHKRFGSIPLKQYPLMPIWEYLVQTKVRHRPKIVKPLDFINYDKAEARQLLDNDYGWVDYGSKHSESRFTKFYQDIFLPKKFNLDKRELHLSSLIVSGQMTREACLAELAEPIISKKNEQFEIKFVAKKLGISADDLMSLITQKPIDHFDYPNQRWIVDFMMHARAWVTGKPTV